MQTLPRELEITFFNREPTVLKFLVTVETMHALSWSGCGSKNVFLSTVGVTNERRIWEYCVEISFLGVKGLSNHRHGERVS
jgi:hypothetical protein